MEQKDKEILKLTADLAWCVDVLERINEILEKDPINLQDIQSARWIVKQGLKVKREE